MKTEKRQETQGKNLLDLFNHCQSELCRIVEAEKFVQCCEFSQRSHAGKGDKVEEPLLRLGLYHLSVLGFIFRITLWRMSLGKSDNLEDKWAKDSLFVFIDMY